MNIFLSIIIFIYTLNVQNNFEVLKTKSGREFKIFKGNDGKTIFFEFCIEKQKKNALLNYWFLILEDSKPFEGKPNIGTTDIQDNEIIRTKDGFTHLVTPNGASSEGVESNKLINAVRRVFF